MYDNSQFAMHIRENMIWKTLKKNIKAVMWTSFTINEIHDKSKLFATAIFPL